MLDHKRFPSLQKIMFEYFNSDNIDNKAVKFILEQDYRNIRKFSINTN